MPTVNSCPPIEIMEDWVGGDGRLFAFGHYTANEFLAACSRWESSDHPYREEQVRWGWWKPVAPEEVPEGMDFCYEECEPEHAWAIPVTLLCAAALRGG